VGEEALHQLNRPIEVNGQRAAALRTTDLRVLALWHLLVWFRLLPCGFTNRDLREQLAVLTGQMPHSITQGRMTYDLRRLRLHGMIERIPKTHRYRVTEFGLRAALFFTRVHARLYRPVVAEVMPNAPPETTDLG
jgi:DNA-binding HxlR family transcriptional regulator